MMDAKADDRLILCVGLVCTDIISVAASYPKEDTDESVLEQRWQRGGNASNSCTVLSQLGVGCEFLGTIAVDEQVGFIKANFEAYNIITDHCVFHEECRTPTSIVIINNKNGSRTILHSLKNLPELSYEDFKKIDLTANRYKWIHFEGRPHCERMLEMLSSVDAHNAALKCKTDRITTSVELEKPRDSLGMLEDAADFVFISKEHARFRGCTNMEDTVNYFASKCRQDATIICAWGDQGALAHTPDGSLYRSSIFPPVQVVDTLAAGDTFNAASIFALSRGDSIATALTFGCRVAGAKVGMQGLDGLRIWYDEYKKSS